MSSSAPSATKRWSNIAPSSTSPAATLTSPPRAMTTRRASLARRPAKPCSTPSSPPARSAISPGAFPRSPPAPEAMLGSPDRWRGSRPIGRWPSRASALTIPIKTARSSRCAASSSACATTRRSRATTRRGASNWSKASCLTCWPTPMSPRCAATCKNPTAAPSRALSSRSGRRCSTARISSACRSRMATTRSRPRISRPRFIRWVSCCRVMSAWTPT